MKRSTWLKIAALLTVLYAIGHTLGFPWTPVRDGSAQGVIDAMQTVRFATEGVSRSYWDFYEGFGLAITGFLVLQAVLLWQLAAFPAAAARQIRLSAGIFLAGFLFNAVIVGRFFFAFPLILVAPIIVSLGFALRRGDQERT